ncbi:hypothetical protein GCM10008019_46390 [Deinococcus soli (ex Cha et al. 2016)]|nr:hypothetical protein GCM10008019_46390 [Deinococcus soli (ex Cha et al. 2016)]
MLPKLNDLGQPRLMGKVGTMKKKKDGLITPGVAVRECAVWELTLKRVPGQIKSLRRHWAICSG